MKTHSLAKKCKKRSSSGNVYKSQGRWEEAILTYEQALTIFHDFGDYHKEGITLQNIAHLYAERGDLVTALPFASDAVAALVKTQDVAGLADARELLADVEADLAASEASRDPAADV